MLSSDPCLSSPLSELRETLDAFSQHSTLSRRFPVQEALLDGMGSLSQAKVGSALQIFFNLDELPQVQPS